MLCRKLEAVVGGERFFACILGRRGWTGTCCLPGGGVAGIAGVAGGVGGEDGGRRAKAETQKKEMYKHKH